MAALDPWLLAAALATAVALSPWAALLGVGLAFHIPAIVPLAGDLEAFGTPWLAVPAALLLVADVHLRTRDAFWIPWEALHLPVRLVLPPLVVVLAAGPRGGDWSPAALAGAAALAVSIGGLGTLLRWGRAVAAEARGRRPWFRSYGGGLGLAAVAGALGTASLAAPLPAATAAAALLVGTLAIDRRALGLGPLAARVVSDLVRSLTGDRGWRPTRRLPRWVRGDEPRRGVPAVLYGEAPGQGTRGGWLVVSEGERAFVFRSPTRVWRIPLLGAVPAGRMPDGGPLLHRVLLVHGDEQVLLATSRAGPSPEELFGPLPEPAASTDL